MRAHALSSIAQLFKAACVNANCLKISPPFRVDLPRPAGYAHASPSTSSAKACSSRPGRRPQLLWRSDLPHLRAAHQHQRLSKASWYLTATEDLLANSRPNKVMVAAMRPLPPPRLPEKNANEACCSWPARATQNRLGDGAAACLSRLPLIAAQPSAVAGDQGQCHGAGAEDRPGGRKPHWP